MNAGHAEFAAEVARIRRRRESAAALDIPADLATEITALINRWLCTNLALCRAAIGRPPGHGAEEEAQRDVVDALGAVWLAGAEVALTPQIVALLGQYPPAGDTWRDYQHERDALAEHFRTLPDPVIRHDYTEETAR